MEARGQISGMAMATMCGVEPTRECLGLLPLLVGPITINFSLSGRASIQDSLPNLPPQETKGRNSPEEPGTGDKIPKLGPTAFLLLSIGKVRLVFLLLVCLSVCLSL